MPEPTYCNTCDCEVSVYWYCDQDNGGPYCVYCFGLIGCLAKHDEGCATKVFEGADG